MKKLLLILTICLVSTPVLAHHQRSAHHVRYSYDAGHVVAHPSGCPWHAFCGCGASARVFGHPVRELFLASNWFRFPRAAAARGMAAVRNHHVFIIEAVNGDGTVTAYDANSGGHQTRVHTVSLAGYTVVNPHGGSFVTVQRQHRSVRYAKSNHHIRHYVGHNARQHYAHARREAAAYQN